MELRRKFSLKLPTHSVMPQILRTATPFHGWKTMGGSLVTSCHPDGFVMAVGVVLI